VCVCTILFIIPECLADVQNQGILCLLSVAVSACWPVDVAWLVCVYVSSACTHVWNRRAAKLFTCHTTSNWPTHPGYKIGMQCGFHTAMLPLNTAHTQWDSLGSQRSICSVVLGRWNHPSQSFVSLMTQT